MDNQAPYIGWHFNKLSGGVTEDGGTTNDVESYKGSELILGLAREICQNSLDARASGAAGPVRVAFNTRTFERPGDYRIFGELGTLLKGADKYWRHDRPMNTGDKTPARTEALIANAEEVLNGDPVRALVVSDYNTTGLCGSKNSSGPFGALIYGRGVSCKTSDTSAGSFGIGRNAPFACSKLMCVCYNTLAEDGESAFVGVAKLASMSCDGGGLTEGQGFYQYNDDANSKWRPIRMQAGDADEFAHEFSRDECGTDVIILGFDPDEDWQEQLVKAVLSNFFLSILDEKLEVEVEGSIIDKSSIGKLMDERRSDPKMSRCIQLYEAMTNPDHSHEILLDGKGDLYYRYGKEVEHKQVVFSRSSGMLVGGYRPQLYANYAAVFIVAGREEEKLLRDTEPADHKNWDPKRIEEKTRSAQAERLINRIKREIKEVLLRDSKGAIGDTVDAFGASDYLPDSIGENASEAGGNDALHPRIKIGVPMVKTSRKSAETIPAKKGTGTPASGEGHNTSKHDGKSPIPPSPVAVSPSEIDSVQGFMPGNGAKTIERERSVRSKARTFARVANQGIYEAVIIPSEDADCAYIRCYAVGEVGNPEPIEIKKATLNGKHLDLKRSKNANKVGPISMRKHEKLRVFLTLSERDALALHVDIKKEV